MLREPVLMKVPKNTFVGTIDYSSDCYDVIKNMKQNFKTENQETSNRKPQLTMYV